jgi:hypothetical protein
MNSQLVIRSHISKIENIEVRNQMHLFTQLTSIIFILSLPGSFRVSQVKYDQCYK